MPNKARKHKKPAQGILARRLAVVMALGIVVNMLVAFAWWGHQVRQETERSARAALQSIGAYYAADIISGEALPPPEARPRPLTDIWLAAPHELGIAAAAAPLDVRQMDGLADRALMSEGSVVEQRGSKFHYARPAATDAVPGGVLRMVWDAEPAIAARLEGSALAILIFLMCALGTAAVLMLHVQRALAPLSRIVAFAGSVGEDNAGARLDIRTNDEFQVLSIAMNRLVRRIGDSLENLRRVAFTDPGTGLANAERLRHELDGLLATRSGQLHPPALLHLAIKGLGPLVSTLGRDAGEEIIGVVADRLVSSTRVADRMLRMASVEARPAVVARLSAFEFAILLPELEGETATLSRYAQMVSAAVAQPLEWRSQRVAMTSHFGAVLGGPEHLEVADILRHADLAMQSARDEGVVFRVFATEMESAAVEKLTFENQLREAVAAGEIIAWFQPKVNLNTGRVESVEALARWMRPDGTMVSPAAFIPVAERIGLIADIGEAVMRDACTRVAQWRHEGVELRVAVNVSPLQFMNERFPARVLKLLDETGLPTHLLEIEVTESAAMSDFERVVELIEPLRARGVRFAIDDFGTGHSSLSLLTRLPFDTFKIDRQFVADLDSDPTAPTLIDTILALADALNYETVAEGVETEDQAEFLRRRGCTLGQGYLFSKPVPPDACLAVARARAERAVEASEASRGGVIGA